MKWLRLDVFLNSNPRLGLRPRSLTRLAASLPNQPSIPIISNALTDEYK